MNGIFGRGKSMNRKEDSEDEEDAKLRVLHVVYLVQTLWKQGCFLGISAQHMPQIVTDDILLESRHPISIP